MQRSAFQGSRSRAFKFLRDSAPHLLHNPDFFAGMKPGLLRSKHIVNHIFEATPNDCSTQMERLSMLVSGRAVNLLSKRVARVLAERLAPLPPSVKGRFLASLSEAYSTTPHTFWLLKLQLEKCPKAELQETIESCLKRDFWRDMP